MTRYSKSWREPKRVTPEGSVKRAIREYLAIKGWKVIVNHQSLGSQRGIPDLTAIKDALTLWIEVKSPKGGKLSAYQEAFRQMCLDQGHLYCVVRSIEDMEEVLNSLTLLMSDEGGAPAIGLKPEHLKGMKLIWEH